VPVFDLGDDDERRPNKIDNAHNDDRNQSSTIDYRALSRQNNSTTYSAARNRALK